MAKGVRKLVRRLNAGRKVFSWDVHHSTLKAAIRAGLVSCGDDCRIYLTQRSEISVLKDRELGSDGLVRF